MASDWPLLTGGRYSEVVVRTGLTVPTVNELQLLLSRTFIYPITTNDSVILSTFRD